MAPVGEFKAIYLSVAGLDVAIKNILSTVTLEVCVFHYFSIVAAISHLCGM